MPRHGAMRPRLPILQSLIVIWRRPARTVPLDKQRKGLAMSYVDGSPGLGATVIGVAAASIATGPTLMALFGIVDLLLQGDRSTLSSLGAEWGSTFFVFVTLMSLIGSIPAACLNAYLLRLGARNEMDGPWFAALSGAVIGALAAVVGGLGAMLLFLPLTGAGMGLLQWAIAIRPLRRSRRSA